MILASRLLGMPAGKGRDVVLLHGLFGQSRNFGALQSALATDFRVAAIDLRNHGASPHAQGMHYGELADDVAETIASLEFEQPAVLGHSMGGKVAMRLALDHPHMVDRLLVADIAPRPYAGDFARHAAAMQALVLSPGLTRREADAALATSVEDAAVRGFLLANLDLSDPPGWRIGLPQIVAGLPDILDWTPHAASFDGPALFAAGERSRYIRMADHATILALFPRARYVTIPAAGHWLHADNPAGFLDVVRGFLG